MLTDLGFLCRWIKAVKADCGKNLCILCCKGPFLYEQHVVKAREGGLTQSVAYVADLKIR